MSIRLDVVVPVRTVDRYLGEALASARGQQGIDCSVVVVDGGSDVPIVIPAPFDHDPAVTLERSELPLTAGGGRNRGAFLGVAEWISFLDADDRWTLASRRTLIDAAVRDGADIAVGLVTSFHSDEESRRLRLPEGRQRAKIAGGIVLSRSVWNRIGPFDATLRSGEFVEWFMRAQSAGARIVEVDDDVIERRVHLQSTTATQIGDRDDYLEVVRRWMRRND